MPTPPCPSTARAVPPATPDRPPPARSWRRQGWRLRGCHGHGTLRGQRPGQHDHTPGAGRTRFWRAAPPADDFAELVVVEEQHGWGGVGSALARLLPYCAVRSVAADGGWPSHGGSREDVAAELCLDLAAVLRTAIPGTIIRATATQGAVPSLRSAA